MFSFIVNFSGHEIKIIVVVVVVSLSFKLVPVQYREYKYGSLYY